jgi:hypothetical protein
MATPPPTTTEHNDGLPSWPRWRLAYALYKNATDWRTRWSALRYALAAQLARNRRR